MDAGHVTLGTSAHDYAVGDKRTQQTDLHSAEVPHVRKRRRKALSCVDCKRRKLKCDRMYPACGRCIKGGYAQSCQYSSLDGVTVADDQDLSDDDEDAEEQPAVQAKSQASPERPEKTTSVLANDFTTTLPRARQAGNTTSSVTALLRSQEEKIQRLENRIAGLEKLVNTPPSSDITSSFMPPLAGLQPLTNDIRDKAVDEQNLELMLFRGKGYRTQFHGQTFAGCLVGKFTELRNIYDGALKRHPAMRRAHAELTSLYHMKSQAHPRPGITDDEILQLLPSADILKSSTRIYLSTFETTYRILHVPSFTRDFQTFQLSSQERRADFAAILLLIVATVSCCTNGDQMRYVGGSSVAREDAVRYIFACQSWLDQHSRKHMTLAFFQVHCLLIVAKRVNFHKIKQTWIDAEHLVSIAVAAGLHRDPSTIAGAKINAFDQEMKRRLWLTIVELDLLTSLERGMPATASTFFSDTAPPRNFDDDELEETMKQLPSSTPLSSRPTSMTSACTSYQSLPLRLRLHGVLNNPSSRLTQSEVMTYTDQVTRQIQQIHEIYSAANHTNTDWSTKPSVSQTTLLLQLYHLLLHLHRFPTSDPPFLSLSNLSEQIRQSSACKMISLHHKLWRDGTPTLVLFRNDLFDAVVNICYDLYITTKPPSSACSTSSPLLNLLSPHSATTTHDSLFDSLETALTLLEDRNLRLGGGTGGSHLYWISLNIYALVRMRLNPEQEGLLEQRILGEREVGSFYRLLSRQVEGVRPSPPRGNGGKAADSGEVYTQFGGTMPQQQAPALPPLSELPEYSAHDFGTASVDNLFENDGLMTELMPWGLDDFWNI